MDTDAVQGKERVKQAVKNIAHEVVVLLQEAAGLLGKRKPSPRLKKAVKIIAKIGGALLLLLILVHTGLNLYWGSELRQALEKRKAAGYPMTRKELFPASVADAENAALDYEKAFAIMKTKSFEKQRQLFEQQLSAFRKQMPRNYLRYFPGESAWTTEEVKAVAALLRSPDARYVLTHLKAAARKPKCDFKLDWEAGPGTLFPHLVKMRDAIHLVAAKARLENHEGKKAEAYAAVLSGLKISMHLQAEPSLVTQMVRIAGDWIMLDSLQALCETAPPESGQATLILAELARHADRSHIVKMFDGETVLGGMWSFERMLQGEMNLEQLAGDHGQDSWWSGLALYAYRPFLKKDFAAYLSLMGKIREICSQPFHKTDSGDMDIWSKLENEIPSYCKLTRLLVPAIAKVHEAATLHFARIEVCRLGLALKLYRARHGAYPETLEELTPAFLKEEPVDPFTGKPLIYRQSGQGFILYSLGPNQKDDKGQEKEIKKIWKGKMTVTGYRHDYDIVWKSAR